MNALSAEPSAAPRAYNAHVRYAQENDIRLSTEGVLDLVLYRTYGYVKMLTCHVWEDKLPFGPFLMYAFRLNYNGL